MNVSGNLAENNNFTKLVGVFLWVVFWPPHVGGLWDPSSSTRDGTSAPYSETAES